MSHKIRPVRTISRAATILPLLFCFLFGLQSSAQRRAVTPGQAQSAEQAEWEAQQKRAAEKAENAKREQEIKKDTDKLLDLATQLKQYVDKTNEHTLSVDVIKKAEEIEKLAHTVKEKMKGQ
jgi:hypothetical protein